jgi:hypothetical protein
MTGPHNHDAKAQPVPRDRIRSIAIILIAAAIAVLGYRLARYSEADDTPGGVVIAAVMIIGAMVLGLSTLRRKD